LRFEVVRMRGDTAFDFRTRVQVLASRDQLTRPARALVRSGDLALSRAERDQKRDDEGNDAIQGFSDSTIQRFKDSAIQRFSDSRFTDSMIHGSAD
jgi:hypothetical protein